MVTIQTQANDRDLLLISVFTFFTVGLWVFFEVLKTYKTTTIPATATQIVVPLSPKIDRTTIKNLEERKHY